MTNRKDRRDSNVVCRLHTLLLSYWLQNPHCPLEASPVDVDVGSPERNTGSQQRSSDMHIHSKLHWEPTCLGVETEKAGEEMTDVR